MEKNVIINVSLGFKLTKKQKTELQKNICEATTKTLGKEVSVLVTNTETSIIKMKVKDLLKI